MEVGSKRLGEGVRKVPEKSVVEMLSPTASDATIEASAETRVVSAGKKRPASLAAGPGRDQARC